MVTAVVTGPVADPDPGPKMAAAASSAPCKADSGTHSGGGAGKILKKIQAWLSIRRQGVRRR